MPRTTTLIAIAACAIALFTGAAPVFAQDTSTATLARIKQSGQIRIGFYSDAHPFSFRDTAGNPTGYSVLLCQRVASELGEQLGLSALKVDWVELASADGTKPVQQGRVDVLCAANRETLKSREVVSFSIPIFPGGIGAVVRVDAPERLRDILLGKRSDRPNWRASAGQLLQAQTFIVVKGSSAETWVPSKLNEFNLTAKVVVVDDYRAGIKQALSSPTNVFFGDRAVLREAIVRFSPPGDLSILDRFFTHEPVALVMARGDEDLRLAVDLALSQLYASKDFNALYAKAFGEPTAPVLTYFRWQTRPE